MFSVGILQDPLEGSVRSTNTCASCTCNFEASARPINIVLQKGHAPCYVLEVDISRNLTGRVPVENIQPQVERPNGRSHTITRVKRGKI